jgi:GntR family transcriptional regulator
MENSFKNKALYHQLVDLLKKRMESGMIPHDKLPSERELTAQYGVSRTTVRLALQELENTGYIYRRHGKGTFVSDIKTAGAYSFTEQMKSLGRHPETRILSFEKMEADKFIAQRLNLPLGEAVFKLSRLRIADREPLMIEDSYLPVKFFLSLDDQLLRSKPLYDLFSEDFKQTVRLADEELYASIASKDDAKQLMIPEGAPVLHLVRQTYNMKNEIIEFTLSVARADQFHYQIRHIRNS